MNVNIDFRVSGRFNDLVSKLHEKYPNSEWSGIARIVKKQWYYELVDIKFPEQTNHGTETEMTKEGIDKLIEDVLMTEPDNMEERRCWLHSHHGMWCFWSWTDAAAKAQFDDGNTKFWFSVVTAYDRTSKKIDYKCALNIFKPIKLEIDIPVTVLEYNEVSLIEEIGQARYDSIQSAIAEINVDKDNKINAIILDDDHSDRYIHEVLDILNSEDNEENRLVVEELIKEQTNGIMDNLKDWYEKDAKYKIDMIRESIGSSYVPTKMEELEKNIVKRSWSQTFDIMWNYGKKKDKKKKKGRSQSYDVEDIDEEVEYNKEYGTTKKRWNLAQQQREYWSPKLWCWVYYPEETNEEESIYE